MIKSWTHKSGALSVCEAEQLSGVLCAQDMLYCKKVLKSMGLKVKHQILLEMDNKGAVNRANNFSVGGQTRHVDVLQCVLRELKESKIMDIHWIKVSVNDAEVFTKSLDDSAFEECIKTLVGQDVYMKIRLLLSKDGVRRRLMVLRRALGILIKKRMQMQT
jgi:hypothetical protein